MGYTKSSLAIVLSKLKGSSELSLKLEQYPTPSELAAELLWQAYMQGDIAGKVIVDAGCGNGILGIGALLLGAGKVSFVDVSEEDIELARQNVLDLVGKTDKAEFVVSDIKDFNGKADVVVENPPFGTKTKHADKVFLKKAFKIAPVIYSIHKITSKRFIYALCQDHGYKVEWVLEKEFMLKQTQRFHKRKTHYIKVGIWKLVQSQNSPS